MKEFSALACISDGNLKCACAKEVCETCEYREVFNCQPAIVSIKEKVTICKINNTECSDCMPVCDKKIDTWR